MRGLIVSLPDEYNVSWQRQRWVFPCCHRLFALEEPYQFRIRQIGHCEYVAELRLSGVAEQRI